MVIPLLKKLSTSLNVSIYFNIRFCFLSQHLAKSGERGGGDDFFDLSSNIQSWITNIYILDGSKVHVLVRRDELRASKVMADRLKAHEKVEIHFNTSPVECLGDGSLLTAVTTKNNKTGEAGQIEASGLFYAIGHDPANSLVKGQVELDSEGYIKTIPGSAETNVAGLFAAGDVQDKRYRQAITSAGSGCMAALDAERYLSEREAELAQKL